MHQSIFIFLFSILFVAGCTKIDSFEGKIEQVRNGELLVGCNHLLDETSNHSSDDVLYTCQVETTDETVVKDLHGEAINLENLTTGDRIHIVLVEPERINKNSESRKVVAKEISLVE